MRRRKSIGGMSQVFSGADLSGIFDFPRRSGVYNPPAFIAAAGPHVNDIVDVLYHIRLDWLRQGARLALAVLVPDPASIPGIAGAPAIRAGNIHIRQYLRFCAEGYLR